MTQLTIPAASTTAGTANSATTKRGRANNRRNDSGSQPRRTGTSTSTRRANHAPGRARRSGAAYRVQQLAGVFVGVREAFQADHRTSGGLQLRVHREAFRDQPARAQGPV